MMFYAQTNVNKAWRVEHHSTALLKERLLTYIEGDILNLDVVEGPLAEQLDFLQICSHIYTVNRPSGINEASVDNKHTSRCINNIYNQ